MTPFIEVVVDEPGFLCLTRVGSWWNIWHCDTGEREWVYGSEAEAVERFHLVWKIKLARVPVMIRDNVA